MNSSIAAAPRKIVFCITELDPGGAERAMVQLVLSLNRDEWEPHVVCLGPRGDFVEVLEAAKIPVVCLNARGIRSFPAVLLRLTRELRRIRPVIVQTFLFHANILGRIAARFAGIPIVVSGIRVAEHRSRWYGRIDRWTNGLVKTNVCVSQGVAEFSRQSSGLDPAKLVVIPNAVEAERFQSARPADLTAFEIPLGSRVLISVGRLDHQKGIDVLLDAIALPDSIADDVHFLIVGDGPDSSALHLRAQANRWAARIHFAGHRRDVPELLAASLALVLPSRWEGMPNVVLEAMAAGKPVVATQVEGIAELVQDRSTGLIVPASNPAELWSAIDWMLQHADFCRSAGNLSQHIVKKQFAQTEVTSQYVELYRKLGPAVA